MASSGLWTVYVYDAFGQIIATYNSQAQPKPNCATCYLTWDHLGSTRLVTDQSWNIVSRHDYEPFGVEVWQGASGRDNSFQNGDGVIEKYTGQQRDQDTMLDFFNARYFSAPFGRFSSADPMNAGADPSDPQTWNGYAYVRNNPMNLTDPSGMFLSALPKPGSGYDKGADEPYDPGCFLCDLPQCLLCFGPGGAPPPEPPPPPFKFTVTVQPGLWIVMDIVLLEASFHKLPSRA